MAHLTIRTPGEAAKIVRAGKLAAVRPEDLQTFGHIYGRAYSFRGCAIHPMNGRYYVVAKYPKYR